MDPSHPAHQTNQDPRALPADASQYQYHASSQTAGHHAQAGGEQHPSYYHPSRYTTSNPPHSSPQYAPQHSPYPQTAAASQGAHANMYSGVPGQTLRDLPFANTHSVPASSRQRHAGYSAAAVPSQAYRTHSQPTPSSSRYDGVPMVSSHSAPEGQQYFSTPAHTMQMYGTHTPGPHASIVIPPSTSPTPVVERYACDKCDKTFSRPHDRKRHYETQHMQSHPHICPYCRKGFSRADSLKRHLDNGCEKAPY